ncbi:3-dehydroquinate synthase [bacterium]|nr:3-dehydroquinate synthase [bacterium]
MTIVNVKINSQKESSYPIVIEKGILDKAYDYITKYTKANKFLVVTNSTVFPLYGKKLEKDNVDFIVLPDGEEYKNVEILNKILDKALEIKMERKDAIIALGGGVIGDMAGFAAAIYQRGIDFIQIPTTLLAQVDSSVGGKVAVNHKLGKNMIGAFYQPKLVLADVDTLETLDERQFKTGLSEVIKYSFIENSCNAQEKFEFYNFLKRNRELVFKKDKSTIKELIKICCSLKSAVVNQDEKEKGLRAILNFGHTYAHAIESITEYKKYTHGEAVSIGMKYIFCIAKELNKISIDYYNSAIELINQYGLITDVDFSVDKEKFYSLMKSDKKVSDSNINFVMPNDNFKVSIEHNIDKNLILKGIK